MDKTNYTLELYVNKMRLERRAASRDEVASALRQGRNNGYGITKKHWTSGHRAIQIVDDSVVIRYFESP